MPPKKKVAAAGGKTAVGGTAKKKKAATKKKKKAEPSAPPPPPPLPDDPWLVYKSRHGGKMSAADEWLKVQRGDTGRAVSLSASQLATITDSGQVISEKLDELLASLPSQTPSMVSESARAERLDKLQGKSAGTDTEPEPELEPKPVSVLSCCSADVASFKLSEALRATLVSLDLTDNSLKCTSPAVTATSQSAPALLSPPVNTLTLPSGGCWLRSLCLRANELVCLPPLASMPKLLHLDLSYNPQLQHVLSLDEQPIREAFAAVPLRSIMLEGIGLAALPPSLATVGKNSGPGGAPRNVVVLHLGYNQIATKTLLEAAVKDFPRLTDLTIAGNPVSMFALAPLSPLRPARCEALLWALILSSLVTFAGSNA